MKRTVLGCLSAAVISTMSLVLVSAMCVLPAGAASFSMTPWGHLGTGSGGTSTTPGADGVHPSGPVVNSAGDGVGAGDIAGTSEAHAEMFKSGTLSDISGGLPAADGSTGLAINASDTAVGYVLTQTNTPVRQLAIEWNGGVAHVLDVDHQGSANGINDAGTIVGSQQVGTVTHAVEFNGVGQPVTNLGDIANPASPENVSAAGISASGEVIGNAINSAGHSEAVTFSGGTASPLPVLPGYTDSTAFSISAANGYIAGYDRTTSAEQAVMMGPGGVAVQLDTLSSDADSAAFGVNSSGLAVGIAQDTKGVLRAVLFFDGTVIDLQSFLPANSGWANLEADGINDNNVIVGHGDLNGMTQGFTMQLPTLVAPQRGPGLIGALLHLVLHLLHLG